MTYAPPVQEKVITPERGQAGADPAARFRRWVRSGLRWFAIVVVFGICTEVFTRIDDALTWDAPLVGAYSNERLLLQDSAGFRGRPGYRYQKWQMNSAGFRGAELPATPAPGKMRIAIAGASETFGLHESMGGEYPARLQVVLDSMAPGRFEILNAALPGMSLQSMDLYLQRMVLPQKPAMVLIYLSPSFYLGEKEPTADYTPPRLRPPPMRQIGPWLVEEEALRSRFAAKSRDILKELVPRFAVTAIRGWRLEKQRALHGPDWVWTGVPQARMDMMRLHLERLVGTIHAAGSRAVLVTHTNRFTGAEADSAGPARRHLLNIMSLYYPQATPRTLVEVDYAANNVMRDVAARLGASVFEAEGKVPPTDENFGDYLHFTDAGADIMARLLAGQIVKLAATRSPAVAPVSTAH